MVLPFAAFSRTDMQEAICYLNYDKRLPKNITKSSVGGGITFFYNENCNTISIYVVGPVLSVFFFWLIAILLELEFEDQWPEFLKL